MILAPLVGLSLVIAVATDPAVQSSPSGAEPAPQPSAQQKAAAIRPLVRSATECVVQAVTADPRLAQSVKAGNLGDLIVDSMTACQDAMRAMIEAHDRLFGAGSGEAFFMGPYLDILPAAVNRLVTGAM